MTEETKVETRRYIACIGQNVPQYACVEFQAPDDAAAVEIARKIAAGETDPAWEVDEQSGHGDPVSDWQFDTPEWNDGHLLRIIYVDKLDDQDEREEVYSGDGAHCYVEPRERDRERLADAAPAMLAALKEAEKNLAYAVEVLEAPTQSAIRENLADIRAAIAKAEGR